MQTHALQALRRLHAQVADVPTSERMDNAKCQAYVEAALLCVEGRFSDALAVATNALYKS